MRWPRRRSTPPSCRSTRSARKRLDFGPAYFAVESTYMVTAASGIETWPRWTVPASASSASPTRRRSAPPAARLKNMQPIAAASIDDALAMLRAGQGRRVRTSRDSLPDFVKQFPGSQIVDGGFQQTVRRHRGAEGPAGGAGLVTAFLEEAKASGASSRQAAHGSRIRRIAELGVRHGRTNRVTATNAMPGLAAARNRTE